MKTDRQLIDDYRNGEESAFNLFYERHRKPVYVYLLSLLRHRETAEEVFQETFFSLLRCLDRLEDRDDMRPFLLRTARHRAIDRLRREERAGKALEGRVQDSLFRSRDAIEHAPVQDWDADGWNDRMYRLPEEQREAVVLRIFLDLRFPEIAELIGVAENTVISRYRYGIDKLRQMIQAGKTDGSRK